MDMSRNAGRKRLGRLPVQNTGSNRGRQIQRPCQIINSTSSHSDKVRSSKCEESLELSISSSFVLDLEKDPNLVTALDKIEQDFEKFNRDVKQNQAYMSGKQIKQMTGTVTVSDKKSQMTPKPVNKATPSAQASYEGLINRSVKSKENRNVTPCRSKTRNMLETPGRAANGKGERTAAESFHDLSFASPLDISTPQIFKRVTRQSSGQKRQLNSAKDIHRSTKKQPMNSPQSTPRRSRQQSAKQVSKKRVLEGLDNDQIKTLETHCEVKLNKTDFFNSLLIDNDSYEEPGLTEKSNSNTKLIKERIEVTDGDVQSESLATKTENKAIIKEREPITKESDIVSTEGTKGHSVATRMHNGKAGEHDKSTCNQNNVSGRNNESVSDINSSTKIQPALDSDQLALSSWGLPAAVLKQYMSRGVTHMFPWQAQCLLLGNVLNGGNLVYSAPTSAGKTMVAELLILKRVMETRKKAIIILPFVSVTREKMFYLQELYQDAGIRVSGFMGHYAPAGGFSNVDVAVCTIEKGNSLVNRLLEENKLNQLGIIVVDELHLIGDPHRGYLLELLLTKISYMAKKTRNTDHIDQDLSIQVVGMSATLPNLDLLARWLGADLYRTDYRPVPLTECVKIGTNIYDNSMEVLREVDVKFAVKGDDEHVVPLCIETLRDGHSILIFCPTKNWCERLAETVARQLYTLLSNPQVAVAATGSSFSKTCDILTLPLDQKSLRDTLEQLRRTPTGLDKVLCRTVQYGVAYHHAGLTFDERDIIEGAFRQGILKVLVATSTLSSGVNLPARRVLVRTPVFYGQLIDFLTYKQMIGRAGRKGVDTAGESILLCKESERTKAEKLVKGALPPVHSTLIRNEGECLSSSMKRAILEVVVSGVAASPQDVAAYAACTLLAASVAEGQDKTNSLILQCIDFLRDNEFICIQNIKDKDGVTKERFVPTQLGAAVLSSSISPDEGLVVFAELQKARQCFVLENELHIIYQVTPIYAQIESIDWFQYFGIWESLSPGMRKVADLVGVQEAFFARAIQGRVPTKTAAQLRALAIHKRFYTCLVLHDLVQEVPLNAVCRKYNCNKGQLQSLQQSAATFAGMVTVFCGRLGWSNLELILGQFQSRLTFGVQRELCDLVRISALNGQRARVLYNGGYQTVAALANAHPADIEALLKNSAPFQSTKQQDSESEWEMAERKKARCIFLTGRRGVTEYEAAVAIISEAKTFIQEELGGVGVQWQSAHNNTPTLKSPVLLSPLASHNRSKTRGRTKKANSERKITSPHSEINNSKLQCFISPPPVLRITSPLSTMPNSENIPEHVNEKREAKLFNNCKQTLLDQGVDERKEGKETTDKNREDKVETNKHTNNTSVNMRESRDNSESLRSDTVKAQSKDTTNVQQTENPEFCARKVEKYLTKAASVITTTAVIENVPDSMETDHDRMAVEHNDDPMEIDSDTLVVDHKKADSERGNHSKNGSKVMHEAAQLKVNMTNKPAASVGSMQHDRDAENITEKHMSPPVAIETEPAEVTPFEHGDKLDVVNYNVRSAKSDNLITVADICPKYLPPINAHNSHNTNEHYTAQRISNESITGKASASVVSDVTDLKMNKKVLNNEVEDIGVTGHSDSEFLDSFAIDTQTADVLDTVEHKKENKRKTLENVNLSVNDNLKSGPEENVFADSEELFSETIPDVSIAGAVDEHPGNRATGNADDIIQDKCLENKDHEQELQECEDIDVSHYDNSLETSHNALDMNITHNSTEDMFNDSAGLIAASNYERVGLSGNSRIDSRELNTSYQDLHIPYQSGQEKCFEQTDQGNVVTVAGNVVLNGKCNMFNSEEQPFRKPKGALGMNDKEMDQLSNFNGLGKFSSQKLHSRVPILKDETLHKDFAAALNMGESFSTTFTIPSQPHQCASEKSSHSNKLANVSDNFGDSLTVSMMEHALQENSPVACDKSKPSCGKQQKVEANMNHLASETKVIHSPVESNVKHSSIESNTCRLTKEINVKHTRNETNNEHQTVKTNEIKNMNVGKGESLSSDKFVYPRQQAVKRALSSPVVNSVKIQKKIDNKYKTPKALSKVDAKLLSNSKSIVETKKNAKGVQKRKNLDTSKNGSTKAKRRSCGSLNTSNVSDCVPPTPPDDNLSGASLTPGTPSRSSLSKQLSTAAFSPRLKRSLRKCKMDPEKGKRETHSVKGKVEVHPDKGKQEAHSDKSKCETYTDEGKHETQSDKGKHETYTNKSKHKTHSNKEKGEKWTDKNQKNSGTFNENSIKIGEIVYEVSDTDDGECDNCEKDEDKLSPSFIDPDTSGLPLTQQSFSIIDVCGDKRLFKTFIMEWRTKSRYSVALACERLQQDAPTAGIGANFKKGSTASPVCREDSGIPLPEAGVCIVGLAVSWDNRDSYYIAFTHNTPYGDPDDSLAASPSDTDISLNIRVKAVKSVLQQSVCRSEPVTITMFDVKAHYRAFVEGCGFAPKGMFEDPKIACWMLDPGAKEKNLHRMVTNLLLTEVHMLHGIGGGIGVSSLGMSPDNPGSGRYRATTEAVLVRHLAEYFRACLEKEDTYKAFCDVEMPAALTLCKMELNGFGFSECESERQKGVMLTKLSALEQQAYSLAGHPFSLSATDDVAQVLFIELQLPPSGDATAAQRPLVAPGRHGRRRGPVKYSTAKDILEKLKKLHPLPAVILEWRRITNALTKTVFPLQKEKVKCDWLSIYRIYGDCQLHTATGRVSMSEPNLQNVPKDFDISIPGGVLLAADYSQLELRMIAYLSNDQKLINVLNADGDVFKLITAQWKNIQPEEVTPDQRAQAKQVCYGMIYGIGPKALGEQIEVEENDAAVFIETFKAKYPSMRSYLRHTVEDCRKVGYVQTMLGRKRYLPQITSINPHARAQAERQAVNTTVQGSAADLVKIAMINIDNTLADMFPHTQYTHRHKLPEKHPSRQRCPPDGGYLVLQLHDELIYEVSAHHASAVAQVVKHCMETARKLPVKMPVKVKQGPSWGKLEDIELT